jgi:hypothetical protein
MSVVHNLEANLVTNTRDQAIDVFQKIISAIPINKRIVLAVQGSEACGKSLASDSMLHYLDDDRNPKEIPNDGKSVLEKESGDVMGRAQSVIIYHNDVLVRFTIAKNIKDVENLEEFDGPDIIVFLQSWKTVLPDNLKPDVVIEMKNISSFLEVIATSNGKPRHDVKRGIKINVRNIDLERHLSPVLKQLRRESIRREKGLLAEVFHMLGVYDPDLSPPPRQFRVFGR